MQCPRCNGNSEVMETRSQSSFIIRRRRQCESCRYRFTTYERIAPLNLSVKKRNGAIEKFSESKMAKGIQKAFTKRPIKKDEFADLVEAIKDSLRLQKKKVITSREIGKLIVDHLKHKDVVAYMRFASVYRGFASLTAFEREIKNLKKEQHDKK
jgi:transcriptional repressor NrdR